MTSDEIIQELERYRSELTEIMERWDHSSRHFGIKNEDDPRYRTFIIEIIDLLNDTIGKNQYSPIINQIFSDGIDGYYNTPSYKSIEDIASVIDSVVTRLNRNPNFYIKKEEPIEATETAKTELKPPEGNNRFGRTYSDALVELLSTWKLAVGLIIIVIAGLIVVHIVAEPGTEVSYLWGLFNYHKAKPLPTIERKENIPLKVEITGYQMPEKQELAGAEKYPILDGTLAIQYVYPDIILSGVNLTKLKIAARTSSGDKQRITRVGISELHTQPNSRIELEYKGNYFGIDTKSVTGDEGSYTSFSLLRLVTPTMDLKEISAY